MRKIIAITLVLVGTAALVQSSVAETDKPSYAITVLSGKGMASRFIGTPRVTSFKCPGNSVARKGLCSGAVGYEAWAAKYHEMGGRGVVQTTMGCRGLMTELRIQNTDKTILDVKFDCNHFGFVAKKGLPPFDVGRLRRAAEAVARK